MQWSNLGLTCISHQPSTAAADKAVSTAFRSVAVLNVLFKYACAPDGRAPCIHGLLPRLATTPGENCRLYISYGLTN